jgi:hypothetical protein
VKLSNKTIRTITETTLDFSFASRGGHDYGMLRACRESRATMLKRFPLRLRSKDPDKEIRLRTDDVPSIQDLYDLVNHLSFAQGHILRIPSALSRITKLGVFGDFFAPEMDEFNTVFLRDSTSTFTTMSISLQAWIRSLLAV